MSPTTERMPSRRRAAIEESVFRVGEWRARGEEVWGFPSDEPDESRQWRSFLMWTDAFAYSETTQERLTQGSAVAALVRSLGMAVAQFSQSAVFVTFDERLQRVEHELQLGRERIATLSRILGVGEERSRLSTHELKGHLAVIREEFEKHFGVSADVVAIPAERAGEPFHVQLDASRGNQEFVASARLAGARARFYEALIELLPAAVLDGGEFDFVFPSS